MDEINSMLLPAKENSNEFLITKIRHLLLQKKMSHRLLLTNLSYCLAWCHRLSIRPQWKGR